MELMVYETINKTYIGYSKDFNTLFNPLEIVYNNSDIGFSFTLDIPVNMIASYENTISFSSDKIISRTLVKNDSLSMFYYNTWNLAVNLRLPRIMKELHDQSIKIDAINQNYGTFHEILKLKETDPVEYERRIQIYQNLMEFTSDVLQ